MKPDPTEIIRRRLAEAGRSGHCNHRAGADHLLRVNDLSHRPAVTSRADAVDDKELIGQPTPLAAE